MVQSAFRNLVDTQYTQLVPDISVKTGKKIMVKRLVAKAYLTYEEVLLQMKANLCDEEVNTFMAYLISTKFPTREQQYARWVASEARKNKRLREKASKEKKVTIEDVIEANKQFIPQTGKPMYWNGSDPESVKGKKILKVKR